MLKELKQKIVIDKTTRIDASYDAKKNTTTIRTETKNVDGDDERDDRCDARPIKERLSGLHFVTLTTLRGKVNISY